LLEQAFAFIFGMAIFQEEGVAQFLGPDFGRVGHIFVQDRVVFRVGFIVKPQAHRQQKKLFFVGFLDYIIGQFGRKIAVVRI